MVSNEERRILTVTALGEARDEAELKAWDSLARYKFQMFGYWAAIWVHLNKLHPEVRANPFTDLVRLARSEKRILTGSGANGHCQDIASKTWNNGGLYDQEAKGALGWPSA